MGSGPRFVHGFQPLFGHLCFACEPGWKLWEWNGMSHAKGRRLAIAVPCTRTVHVWTQIAMADVGLLLALASRAEIGVVLLVTIEQWN